MSSDSRVTLGWPAALAAALALVGVGAIGSYLATRGGSRTSTVGASVPAPNGDNPSSRPPASTAPAGAAEDVVVTLSDEAMKRAGIAVSKVEAGASSALRLPAVVEPNAYKRVSVTSLVPGRISRVLVESGANVRVGQTMATIFSPDLAEAQTRYISARAELDAHERELARIEKLVEIGSASRQELERAHAEHTSKRTAVESARSRLELLGVSRETIDGLTQGRPVDANAEIPAPISGVVTERLANVGANVDPSTKLFTVDDLSSVWIAANLFESDFSRVQVGNRATIVTAANPDLRLQGRVSYIDPQLSPESRTAKVRVEVPNSGQLRFGMLAEALIESAERATVTMIPRSAVQNLGDRSLVYVLKPGAQGQFIERAVRLGSPAGERVQVLSGLMPGDQLVTEGSFFLRAERDRLGLQPSQAAQSDAQAVKILVTEQGYEPAKVSLKAGIPARLSFVRTTDKTCGTEVVFPSLNIKRALPLNQAVDVTFTPTKSGDITFVCGMNMLKGVVVVE